MNIKRIEIDTYLITDNDIEYILEIEDRYDDIWIEVTRKDGKEITPEEVKKVTQYYYEQ